jgi:DNA-binding NtrC family response regulator
VQTLKILIVEDGRSQREMLRDFLREAGYEVMEAADGRAALKQVENGYVDLLFIDYKMPGMDGMELLSRVKQINPETDAIMMTAYGTVERAVEAMKRGAEDYITKPIELEEVRILVERIRERRILVRENRMLKDALDQKAVTSEQIIYKSRAMEAVINLAGRVAESRASVLIQGESGTGKELLARLIHTLSPRSNRSLIVVNCAALPESLLESELFGHEKGAFTGASQRRTGRFEAADEGTLFLDEIGELSLSVQVKLLRFLQEKEFQRLGGNTVLNSDVRVISATNRDLKKQIEAGAFREDLYYRLNVVPITISPLRARKEDLSPLIDHFLACFARENGKALEGVLPEARDLLYKYDYPGNVRELENILERAVVIARGTMITPDDLPFGKEVTPSDNGGRSPGNLKEAVEGLEKEMIQTALDRSGGHQTRAAENLGISERMLRYKLKKYGLKG